MNKKNNFVRMAKKNYVIFFFLAFFIVYIDSCSLSPNSGIEDFYNYPNPFNSKETSTTYKVSIKSGEIMNAKLEIYSTSGDLLDNKDLTVNEKIATCQWAGLDKNGKYLPAGVYIAKITVKDSEDSTFIEEFKTFIK
ncbi:FlgD immunoglobulin-like domain containing protein [Brachyspira aalborgi]|uniref:FlgD immunoglobulin-like domain containing protein n=1 Tax=Brachyspira aalborgi TaxID=29522 RepID=UPI00266D49AB|nr:FlgD immunoglobulin-like domain containing protein [Brachyspira aalborgi]